MEVTSSKEISKKLALLSLNLVNILAHAKRVRGSELLSLNHTYNYSLTLGK
jgi:hypothetical protein